MKDIPLTQLKVSPCNIRHITTTELKEEMESLKQSIKSKGIIEPLIVRKSKDGFEVVVGQRRFLSAKAVGLKEVPCIIKELSDQEATKYSIIENLQRKNPNDMDVAKALKKLVDFNSNSNRWSKTEYVEQILPKQLGLKKSELWNYLSLLNLVPEVQEMVSEDKLGVKLASQLATVEKEKQEEVAKLIGETSTEDQAIELIKKVKEEPEKKPEEVFEEVQPKNEMKVVIFFRNEKVDFKLPIRYWRTLSDISTKTKKTFSELIREALDGYLRGLGYDKNK
ncbi:MAG: ParB/RepB/Spo0J family partition protein [bacterium]